MKKLIPLFLLISLLFCGCSAKEYTPVISTDFTMNAVYKTGDFSYNCVISKENNVLSVTPTTTRAAGMIITYDGKNVTFSQKSMLSTFNKNTIDSTNPAVVLYQVFKAVESTDLSQVKRVENTFQYTGKTDIGDFVLIQNEDNSFDTLTIRGADIIVTFV